MDLYAAQNLLAENLRAHVSVTWVKTWYRRSVPALAVWARPDTPLPKRFVGYRVVRKPGVMLRTVAVTDHRSNRLTA